MAFYATPGNAAGQTQLPVMTYLPDKGTFHLYTNEQPVLITTFDWKADGSYESGTTKTLADQNLYYSLAIRVNPAGQWISIQKKSPQGPLTILRDQNSADINDSGKTSHVQLKPGIIPYLSYNPALMSMAVRAYDATKAGKQTFSVLSAIAGKIELLESKIERLNQGEWKVNSQSLKLVRYLYGDSDGESFIYVDENDRVILWDIPFESKIYVRQGYEELRKLIVPGPWIRAQEFMADNAPSLTAKIDGRLSRWFEANQPGAAVLLMQDGKVLFKKGYGLANVELGVPIQPDMVFRIGSVTKQFTAAAIMLLVEEGKVDLQAPISSYLEKLPKAWKEITVEQLLNHTSGIPNYTRTQYLWEHAREDLTPSQLLEKCVSDRPLDFGDPPGTQIRYTNTGYILLGMIIEKVSGQPYARFLQKRLFGPLDLKHTRYDSETELIPGMTSGYIRGPKPAPFWSVTQKYSAGALVSNAEDLAQWTLALHDGKVVKPESLARMLKSTRLRNGEEIPYGFGLGFRQSQGDRLVGHSGGVNGFTCLVEADPAVKAVAVILNNTSAPKWNEEYITRYLLALAAGKPLPELKPVAIDPSKLGRLAGRYTLGVKARTITFDGKNLFNQSEGDIKRMLIPLSETEFGYEDVNTRLRFELTGDKVIGVYRRIADAPEESLQKRMEPIEDKDPQVTALVQQYLREAVDGTLKPGVFTPNLAAKIFPDQVNEAAALLKSLGTQTGIDLYEREDRGGGGRFLYRVSYGDKHVILRLSLMEDNRISEVDFFLE